MRKMYGVEMQAPKGKLPGFYAQVVHKIGDHVNVFDRDRQLLIVENEHERDTLIDILNKASMTGELFDLWLLPKSSRLRDVSDYGFTSVAEHTYLYTDLVHRFFIDQTRGLPDDRWAALEQMKEHLIGIIETSENGPLYIVEGQHAELIEGIARVFHITIQWNE